MINAPQLLADLTKLLKRLEGDLLKRIEEVPELRISLQAEWQAARDANRCAETFETWVDQVITQAGVHWLLSCVFLRFIEDNKLVDRPWLSGTLESGHLALARDRHEAYFRANPLHSDREYLLASFREAGRLPGLYTFFDEGHNPIFRLGISGDAAMAVRQFWQQVDPNTGVLAHDFTDPTGNTRFLGDLYQDLSEATRKRYALLQTPDFVEEFILDRTLTPAIREFGYRTASLIDPTCGSGHFLLGAFHRFVDEWQRAEPSRNRRDIAQKALDAVAGVDLNPFAIAISRFRLLVAALLASDVHKLSEAPDFRIHVAIGDSLLHGRRFGMTATEGMFEDTEHYAGTGLAHAYATEDLADVRRILGRQYHAVVGNPPYIVVSDASTNAAYRRRYASCHRQYSLGVPFTERFFDLAQSESPGNSGGFVGIITANSFMKREFGSKLVEQFFPRIDLSHILDTAGAYIPGHGTPTTILFGRNRKPYSTSVRVVMGVKGEPSTPTDPAKGLVWSSIVECIDRPGFKNEFISTEDIERATVSKHPWSLGGQGSISLLELLRSHTALNLINNNINIGAVALTRFDDAFVMDGATISRLGLDNLRGRQYIRGEDVRDWTLTPELDVIWPYEDDGSSLSDTKGIQKVLWPFKSQLRRRVAFGKSQEERGLPWYSYSMLFQKRFNAHTAISFTNVSTHNHFSVVEGGKVFNAHAPLIMLDESNSKDDYISLAGLLNSSIGCFWLQQVSHNKGGPGGGSSKDEKWHDFYEYGSSAIAEFPIPSEGPLALARNLHDLAHQLVALRPSTLLKGGQPVRRHALDAACVRADETVKAMISVQEELDWHCYSLYGIIPENIVATSAPKIRLGERAFEIVLARQLEAGKLQTKWFEWLGIVPVTQVPSDWPADYQALVHRRIELIETDKIIGLVESTACKRRWESTSWQVLERAALRNWMLIRLESRALWPATAHQAPQLTTTSRLADTIQRDADFMQIAALYAGHADFDVAELVAELVIEESVPFLPALRYSDTGLRKRAQWQACWDLQRQEDAGEKIGDISSPPKYQSKDFLKTHFWRLRGSLDVSNERWVSYPGCERGADTSLPIAWAGWDHLQQATALAAYYLEMKESEGWDAARLQPLLAGLLELVPWLEQWHNEVDPVYSERMGAYYKGFVSEEARAHGFTLDNLRAWKPAVTAAKRGRKKASV